jgi:hypothetical protein
MSYADKQPVQQKSKFESAFGSFGKKDIPSFVGNAQSPFPQEQPPFLQGEKPYPSAPMINSEEAFSHKFIDNVPNGRVFKNGGSLLKPVKAFDRYDMEAIHVDTDNVDGNVREINGRLYAKGENPIIEYTPTEQIIQPNGHITSLNKNHEADKLVHSLKQQQIENQHKNQDNGSQFTKMLPTVLLGSLASSVVGAFTHHPTIVLGSLAVAGMSLWFANEATQKEIKKKDADFRKKFDAH